MSISKKLKDGKVSYEVFVKGRDASGKQVGLRRMGISNEREAKRIEFELKSTLQGHKGKVSWSNWSEHFLYRYKNEFSPSTYINYKHNLGKWVTPIWKEKFLDDITPSDVHFLIYEHLTNVSSYTRKTFLKLVRRVFNMAIEEGVLSKNPAMGIKVRLEEVNQLVLNKSEIDVFLKHGKIVNHRFYPHWTLALLTGMRSGELQALRWTDIDLETGFISIKRSWSRFLGEGPTKTAKNRVCPISKECRKLLLELKMQTGPSDHVLPRLTEWSQGQQAQVIKDFCKGLNITPIKFHDLRATFITQMLNNGVPLAKVMAIVGHSSLKTTQGYLRLCGKDVEGATDLLGVSIPEAQSNNRNNLYNLKR